MFDGMSFDEFSKLYKENPEEFHIHRKGMLDKTIESSRNPQRYRAMQWEIDQRLDQQPNDIARMVYINKRMHDSLAKLRDVLNEVVGVQKW